MGIFDRLKKQKQEVTTTEGSMCLFCTESSLDKIMDEISRVFGLSSEGKGNTIELHNGDIEIYVLVGTAEMGEEANAYIKNQVERTWGHFYEVETEDTDIKTNVLYQIKMTRGFAQIQYSYIQDEALDKRAMIADLFGQTLGELGGILLVQGEADGLYCKQEEQDMELILDDSGESGLIHYLPAQVFAMTTEDGEVTEEQIERRRRSRAIIEEKFIYVPSWYPLIESEQECRIRTPEEIAKRAVALMSVAVYSECLLAENMTPDEAFTFIRGRMEEFGAEEFLSPEEKIYLHNPDSTEKDRISYSWQYENLFVMEWALGLVDDLDFPDHICDVPLTVRLLKDCSTIGEILEKSTPRSAKELLDACDLIFCLDWACVDTRIHNFPAPASMDGGVVMERHKSLNWLIGAEESADWDEVSTNT